MMFVSSSSKKIAKRLEKEYAITFGEKNFESASGERRIYAFPFGDAKRAAVPSKPH